MTVEVDHSENDSDLLSDINTDMDDDEEQPKLSAKEASQHILEVRRKLEDRLERRRLSDELGSDDLGELDF